YWNVQDSPKASEFDRGCKDRFTLKVSRGEPGISNMNRAPRPHNATDGSLRTRPIWSALPELGKCGGHAKHRGCADRAILESKQRTKIGVADADRVRQHGLKN